MTQTEPSLLLQLLTKPAIYGDSTSWRSDTGETITIISKDGAGNESQPATAVIPADVVLAAPTITKVEGNKANGYTVTGTADPNVTVQFYNSSEQLLASGNTTTGGTFSVHIAAGLATEKKH